MIGKIGSKPKPENKTLRKNLKDFYDMDYRIRDSATLIYQLKSQVKQLYHDAVVMGCENYRLDNIVLCFEI